MGGLISSLPWILHPKAQEAMIWLQGKQGQSDETADPKRTLLLHHHHHQQMRNLEVLSILLLVLLEELKELPKRPGGSPYQVIQFVKRYISQSPRQHQRKT